VFICGHPCCSNQSVPSFPVFGIKLIIKNQSVKKSSAISMFYFEMAAFLLL
jgi:hypothetical protein